MNERDLEHSEARVTMERETAIRESARIVGTRGTADCVDCGEAISAERQRAAPFSTRCINCQRAYEREARLYG